MKLFISFLLAVIILCQSNYSHSCNGLSTTVVSNSYIGNGEYLIAVEICEFVSNSQTTNGVVTDWASIFGIIITVNGANIIGINTPSITGVSTGVTLFPTQTASNQVEYGDWGNSNAPVFLDYGDPQECWTFEFIVDGPGVTVNVWTSSSESATQPGGGMVLNNGIWGCGEGVGIPPAVCDASWTPPVVCAGSTTPIDLYTTTSGNGVFTGPGVDSLTGMFDPSGFSSNVTITYTVGDQFFNCSSSQDITFINLAPPTLNDTTICVGDTVALDASLNVAAGCAYTLVLDDNFGDGWNGADLDIYINGVLYLGNQTVPNCGGSLPCQITINIPVNTGDIILLNYTGGTWDSENTIFLYDAQGNLVYSINNPPDGNLGNGTIVTCPTVPIDYLWTPSAGLSDPNIANPLANPASTTTYTVTVSSATLGCSQQTQVTITTVPCGGCTPPIIITDDLTLCSPNNVDLNSGINGGSGPGNATFYSSSANANNAVNAIGNTVSASGYYYVRYEDPIDPQCFSIDSILVTVYPTSNTTENITVCQGSTVVYPDGTSELITGNTSHISNLQTVNGCDSLITTNVTSNPSYSSTVNVSLCAGSDYTFPDGVIHSNITASEVYDAIFVSSNGCDSTITTNITINQIPVVDAGNNFTICEGENAILTAFNPSGASISWNNGVQDGVLFAPTSTQTYTVTATDPIGCSSSDSVTITVATAPVVNFVADTLFGCVPHEVIFTNLTPGNSASCLWQFGDGSTSSECSSVLYTYNNPGLYTVTLTVTDINGCTGSLTIDDYIEVTNVPLAGFYADDYQLDIFDTEVFFTNTSVNAENYTWQFSDGSPDEFNVNSIHTFPEEPGIYVVTLIAENSLGCSDTAYAYIMVNDVLIYYVPNTFTPDGDAYNNEFKPIFTRGYDPYDYHLMIFNRWGEILFESYDVNYGWKGTYPEGNLVQDGTYTWKIDFKETMTDKRHEAVGHINLIR